MREWLREAKALDGAVYAAIAASDTPTLDGAMRNLSRAADQSKLWFATAGALALVGGSGGRRAARNGLVSLGIASGFANLVAKPLTASAFAFATGAANAQPLLSAPLRALATLVGYSRVHTGVHYPADVLAGAFIGVSAAEVAGRLLGR